jgi:peroxiredoxin
VAALHEELGGKGLEVVGVSIDSEASEAAAFVAKKKSTWKQAHAGARSPISEMLGVEAIPTFFVIDRDGTVLYRGSTPEAAARAARAALAK